MLPIAPLTSDTSTLAITTLTSNTRISSSFTQADPNSCSFDALMTWFHGLTWTSFRVLVIRAVTSELSISTSVITYDNCREEVCAPDQWYAPCVTTVSRIRRYYLLHLYVQLCTILLLVTFNVCHVNTTIL